MANVFLGKNEVMCLFLKIIAKCWVQKNLSMFTNFNKGNLERTGIMCICTYILLSIVLIHARYFRTIITKATEFFAMSSSFCLSILVKQKQWLIHLMQMTKSLFSVRYNFLTKPSFHLDFCVNFLAVNDIIFVWYTKTKGWWETKD